MIIIGSGPAGLTAAIYAARANVSPLVIAGYKSGGQLMDTTEVENYPGFAQGIMGPELMMNMRKQAERFGATFIDKDVTKVDFSNPKLKKVFVGDTEYAGLCIIVATGASARWLDVPGEEALKGRGVSVCATCDGAFYRGKTVAVVGGGDSAMEEASFLTKFADKVLILHRREEFRASKIMQERVFKNPKIEVIWNTIITEVHGERDLSHASLVNTKTGEASVMNLDGIFVAIGHDPNTKFLQGQIELDEKGYVRIQTFQKATDPDELSNPEYEPETATNIEGVFVAGDVHDIRYKQAITAAGSGCKASLDAEKYLAGIE